MDQIIDTLIAAGFAPREVGDHLVVDVGPDLGTVSEAEEARYLALGDEMLRRIRAVLPAGVTAEHHDSGATIVVEG